MTLKSAAQIERMAVAGRLVADVLDASRRPSGRASRRSSSTPSPRRSSARAGGMPSFIGVPGRMAPYPPHAVRLDRRRDRPRHPRPAAHLATGQIVSIDAGAIVDGWHGDAARTFIVGEVPDAVPRALVDGDARGHDARASPRPSPGNHIGDISARRRGRRPGRRLRRRARLRRPRHRHRDARGAAGHQLPHRLARPAARAGLCLAIEPMFTLGRPRGARRRRRLDGRHRRRQRWPPTGSTRIAVTADGPRILTASTGVTRRQPLAGDGRDLIHSAVRASEHAARHISAFAPGRLRPPGRDASRSTVNYKRSLPPPVAKKDAIEVEGTVIEPLPNAMFAIELENRPPRPGPHQRQAAHELHPHPARRPGPRRALAVRPLARPDHVSTQVEQGHREGLEHPSRRAASAARSSVATAS